MANLAIAGGDPQRHHPYPSWPIWTQAEVDAVQAVVTSGRWISLQGTEVQNFENEFAAYHDAVYGIAVVNGTVALKLALTAAGVGVGDEVLMPGYTFVATATAALEIGAVPVFADIDPETYTIDPVHAAALITPRTRAIVPVHLGGRPADMDAILDLAREHDLAVIEDAAQAWGSAWNGAKVGALGQIGGISFQASKNITAGEGGMMLTNDPAIGDMARSLSNCGRQADGLWYAHYVLGGNYRLSEFQGAVLRVQLQRYPEHLERRQANAAYLERGLAEIDGISTMRPDPRVTANAYHLFFMRYDADAFGRISKHRFIRALQAEGIQGVSGGYSLPVYRQPVMQAENFGLSTPPLFHGVHPNPPDYRQVALPATDRACDDEAVWLRQSMLLGDRQDMYDIIEAILKLQRYRDELQDE
ncbi:DegT/DnrJ/EryC1/StrS family aminotransferase [Candidatus Entotheonella palauensis]|uniref:DegT/DnrJ/EryC1/StrS family aminotransferase n=1 Tax=Candidatus Entotheonella palauensis TaxID=93172 RepID=UPI000B7F739D|nr:DegT/DnrJ/EryC1/StrS family aminotransferase [Candidatus Entotheonella palauensis]